MPLATQQALDLQTSLLQQFGGQLRCPICMRTLWDRPEVVIVLSTNPQGGTSIQGSLTSLLKMRCQQCSYVVLFDAASIGPYRGLT